MSGVEDTVVRAGEMRRAIDDVVGNINSQIRYIQNRQRNANIRMNQEQQRRARADRILQQQIDVVNQNMRTASEEQRKVLSGIRSNLQNQQIQIQHIRQNQERIQIEQQQQIAEQAQRTEQLRQQVTGRMDHIERRIQGLNDKVDRNNAENRRQIRDLKIEQQQMKNEYRREIKNVRQTMFENDKLLQNQITQNRNEFRSSIKQTREEFRIVTTNLQTQVNNLYKSIANEKERQKNIAHMWSNLCKQQFDIINKTDWKLHAKQEYEKLLNQFENLKQFDNPDSYQVYTSRAVDMFNELQDLNTTIQERAFEYDEAINELSKALASASDYIGFLSDVTYEVPYKLNAEEGNVDFWTEGKLTDLRKQAANIASKYNHLF